MTPDDLRALADAIRGEVAKAIVGQDTVVVETRLGGLTKNWPVVSTSSWTTSPGVALDDTSNVTK